MIIQYCGMCVRMCEQICNMQNCVYDFSLVLQMAFEKATSDEIVGRDIETANKVQC